MTATEESGGTSRAPDGDELSVGFPPQKKAPRRKVPRYARWTKIERDLRAQNGPMLAGVDEVGRGPIAGPVVACAVIMPPGKAAIRGVDDSKKLSAKERVKLAEKIRSTAIAYALGAASVREIERLNIYQASALAMHRALSRLKVSPDHVVIDGKTMRSLPVPHTAVVHGDARCFSIACASILAKVCRDDLMARLALRHPGYAWERNAGYTVPEHIAGLAAHGITVHHRRSFVRISQLAFDFSSEVLILDATDAIPA